MIEELIARLGDPITCYQCGKPTPPRELTETTRPGPASEIVPGVEIRPQRLVWICRTCRRDGGMAREEDG